jgi:hypothetical protein
MPSVIDYSLEELQYPEMSNNNDLDPLLDIEKFLLNEPIENEGKSDICKSSFFQFDSKLIL